MTQTTAALATVLQDTIIISSRCTTNLCVQNKFRSYSVKNGFVQR